MASGYGECAPMEESALQKNVNLTMTESLKHERKRLEERLANVNEAIKQLEDNPGVAKAVDAITRLGHLR